MSSLGYGNIKSTETDHQDYLLDICYDFHGKRLATCSADKVLKIWNKVNDEWILNQTLTDAGTRVDWAHPEFGSIIASCSDQAIIIWEEMFLSTSNTSNTDDSGPGLPSSSIVNNMSSSYSSGARIAESSSSSSSSTASSSSSTAYIIPGSSGFGKKWKEAAKITQSKGSKSLVSIKFSPRHLGLQFAVCSDDGFVRIYRATDPTSLSAWTMEYEFETSSGSSKSHSTPGITCLSWNPSQLDRINMIVIGTVVGSVMIWKLDHKKRKWVKLADLVENDDIKQKSQKVIGDIGPRKGTHLDELSIINEVSWAPNMGRSFHLIASASGNGTIKIWKLSFSFNDEVSIESFETETLKHGSEAWKVEWNVTGTVLATSGDDGKVKLWKCEYSPSLFINRSIGTDIPRTESTWKCFEEISN